MTNILNDPTVEQSAEGIKQFDTYETALEALTDEFGADYVIADDGGIDFAGQPVAYFILEMGNGKFEIF